METVVDDYETWTGPSWRWPTADAHEEELKAVLASVRSLYEHPPTGTEPDVWCSADGESYPCAFLKGLVSRFGDRKPALTQLNDGSYKRRDLLTSEDLDSVDAWNKRKYARALTTRKLLRDGRWDQLRCDFLMPGGEFCDRPGQRAGDLPIGEPHALCREHASCATPQSTQ